MLIDMSDDEADALDINALTRLLTKANIAYGRACPIMSDEKYDSLIKKLRIRDPNSELLNKVGFGEDNEPQQPNKGIKHSRPMLSLDKTYKQEDVESWANKLPGKKVATLKLDGMALALRFSGGLLSLALTRSDGEYGEDVTDAVRELTNIPKKIPVSRDLEVRGEAYLPFSAFEQIKRTMDGNFKNPRNLAAGAVKTRKSTGTRTDFDDQKKQILGLMKFEAYDVLDSRNDSYKETLATLAKAGFLVPPVADSLTDAFKLWEETNQNREMYDKPVDGIVVRLDSYNEFENQGYTSHHPRGATAYKFSAEVKETTLRSIEWQVGRTGKITPVAIVDPTEFSSSGVTVTRASLHNLGIIDSLGVTIGCTVRLQRSGDVIPMIVSVIKPGTSAFVPPTTCPLCHAPTKRESDFLLCTGDRCQGSLSRTIEHYCKTTDIDGFGPAIIETLYDKNIVRKFSDLYTKILVDQTELIAAVGKPTADKLRANVEAAKTVPLEKFLDGLGIQGLGTSMSKKIAAILDPPNMDGILKLSESVITYNIDGLGDSIRQSIISGIPKMTSDLLLLKDIIKLVREEKKTGSFSGMSFVFTGTLSKMGRSEAQKKVSNMGAETPSGVKTGLTYLVVGTEDGGKSSKQIKAEKLGVKILNEDEFLKLIG